MGLVRDYTPQDMLNNIILHASLGKTYGLPVVITTSSDKGDPACRLFGGTTFYSLIPSRG